eukprot:406065-Pelagomonas_calceolata.AAC.1
MNKVIPAGFFHYRDACTSHVAKTPKGRPFCSQRGPCLPTAASRLPKLDANILFSKSTKYHLDVHDVVQDF